MIKDKDKLKKRAYRKMMSHPALYHLMNLNSPLKKKYIQSYYCSQQVQQVDGKLRSHYCKRMWCNICAPIRTAVRINNYSAQLHELNDLHLTTLTCTSVTPGVIKDHVQIFRQVFRQFRNTYKKSTGITLKGVYNFECTHSRKLDLYHPHIHIIHEGSLDTVTIGKYSKNLITEYWQEKSGLTTDNRAQDSRKCYDIIEGFKYATKSIYAYKINGKIKPYIPAVQLDQIYQQLAGVRCFQSFGINKIPDTIEEKQLDNLTAYISEKAEGTYVWNKKIYDWEIEQHINPGTGEIYSDIPDNSLLSIYTRLSDHKPTEKQIELLKTLTHNENY